MADFTCIDNMWDLDLTVDHKGYFVESAVSTTSDIMAWLDQPFIPQQADQGQYGLFSDFLDATTNPVHLDGPVGSLTDSSPWELKEEDLQNLILQEGEGLLSTGNATTSSKETDVAPKSYKKRKNHQKRVVQHVKADDVSSDLWAWRKYGQKPIKGSSFPRSYYRCSSSKGCMARKQVEKSNSDQGTFVVTYTGQHNHSHPTRRSSLAGSTRTSTKIPKQHHSPSLAEELVAPPNKDHNSQLLQESLVFSEQTDGMVMMGWDELEMAEWPWILP